jgi:L,D-peptidoglycan transpeptidase YkuD (ErfK/YbiS/YcfS/YnhG family)
MAQRRNRSKEPGPVPGCSTFSDGVRPPSQWPRRRWCGVSAVVAIAAVATAAMAGGGMHRAGATVTAVRPQVAPAVIVRSATASAAAVTGTSVQLVTTLPPPVDPHCRLPVGVPSTARQVVNVDASGTAARVDLLELVDGAWVCTRENMVGRVGKNGVRALADRVSGDGTTPAGIFPLGTMTAPDGQVFQFFGNGADPGVQGAWRQVQSGDCWDETGGRSTYNTLTRRSATTCTGSDEYLPAITEAYSRAALIGANMGPDRSGDQPGEVPHAAGIFLHRFSYDAAGNAKPTSGCVSLAGLDLDAVLTALVPGQAWFVITT